MEEKHILEGVRFLASVVLTLGVLLSLPARAGEPALAGEVHHLQGSASVERGGRSDALALGHKLYVGDRISTGKTTRLGVKMTDGGVLRIGEQASFAVEAYYYAEEAKEGRAHISLFKGAMRAITGAIAKFKEHDFKIKTAMATTGVRGTDFWVGIYFSDALDVALFEGKGVYVTNTAGSVEISRAGDGTTVKGADAAPGEPFRWGQKKYDAAVQSVAWEGETGLVK